MSNYLFPNVLKEDTIYQKAKQFWIDQCQDVLNTKKDRDQWVPFGSTVTLLDGSILQDGNPIYAMINYTARKSISITQYEPSEHWHTKAELESRINFDHNNQMFHHLIYRTPTHPDDVVLFKALFSTWSNKTCTIKGMKALIEAYKNSKQLF
jgi:hypothetical protein